MFQLEKINHLFNCQICKDLLVDPIILPCGETVCNVHTEKISEENCLLCTEMHTSPKSGFPSNKIVKNQLDLKINKINLNFRQFNDYNTIIQDLNEHLKQITPKIFYFRKMSDNDVVITAAFRTPIGSFNVNR